MSGTWAIVEKIQELPFEKGLDGWTLFTAIYRIHLQ